MKIRYISIFMSLGKFFEDKIKYCNSIMVFYWIFIYIWRNVILIYCLVYIKIERVFSFVFKYNN